MTRVLGGWGESSSATTQALVWSSLARRFDPQGDVEPFIIMNLKAKGNRLPIGPDPLWGAKTMVSYGFRTFPPRECPKPWISRKINPQHALTMVFRKINPQPALVIAKTMVFRKINPQPALGIAKTMVFDWCRRLGRRGNVFLKCPENQVGFVLYNSLFAPVVNLQFLSRSCTSEFRNKQNLFKFHNQRIEISRKSGRIFASIIPSLLLL